MRKYRNLYHHDGKWYTKEKRVAKIGEKVLIVDAVSPNFINYEVYTVLSEKNNYLQLSNGHTLMHSKYLVLVPYDTQVKVTNTNTYWDEFTQMEQQHNFIIQERGAGKKAFMAQLEQAKKAQPVPFSNEYYGRGNGKSSKATENVPIGYAVENINAGDMLTLDAKTGEIKKAIIVPVEKRNWTDAEITEAKRYVADKMSSLNIKQQFICFYKDMTKPTESIAVLYERTTPSWGAVQDNNFEISTDVVRKAIAKCMPTDEQNDHIGKMVATKKLFNEELPAWIVGDKK